MTTYIDDQGKEIRVGRGLDNCWIVKRGYHRVKSPALPPRETAAQCQQDLDRYAAARAWKAVEAA